MSNVASNNIVIELHVPDFDKVKEFYGKLGFDIVWERNPEGFKGYFVMKKGSSILCFWGGNNKIYSHPYFKQFSKDTKKGYGVEIVIFVENIDKYYEKVRKFAKVVEELTLQPWGDKDFRVEDPFGYYLRFSNPYNTLHAEKVVK